MNTALILACLLVVVGILFFLMCLFSNCILRIANEEIEKENTIRNKLHQEIVEI